MTQWIRFEHGGKIQFGTLEDGRIAVHEGNMFDQPKPNSETVALEEVKVLTPTEPSKIVALWNNFKALGQKLNLDTPEDPLYFIKATTSALAGGELIRRPASYDGKVIFEGELGIVIGKECRSISEGEADDYIFGYTCINDVTAVELLNKDASFAQWTRAKSFDTFGVFGPVVSAGLNPDGLSIVSVLNGDERQNYPVSDMIFQPRRLVSLVSHDLTLVPGDVIACGTSVGVGSMKPGSTIDISIEGIGTLSNKFE